MFTLPNTSKGVQKTLKIAQINSRQFPLVLIRSITRIFRASEIYAFGCPEVASYRAINFAWS